MVVVLDTLSWRWPVMIVLIDNVKYGAGPGTVVALGNEIPTQYIDRDGCKNPRIRVWRAFDGVKVGDRVGLP